MPLRNSLALFAMMAVATQTWCIVLAQDPDLLGRAIHKFNERDFASAESLLTECIQAKMQDARCYYFRGLIRFQQGKGDLAREDFEIGSNLEEKGKPSSTTISASLQKVQGEMRLVLEERRKRSRVQASLDETLTSERASRGFSKSSIGIKHPIVGQFLQFDQEPHLVVHAYQSGDGKGIAALILLRKDVAERSLEKLEQLKTASDRESLALELKPKLIVVGAKKIGDVKLKNGVSLWYDDYRGILTDMKTAAEGARMQRQLTLERRALAEARFSLLQLERYIRAQQRIAFPQGSQAQSGFGKKTPQGGNGFGAKTPKAPNGFGGKSPNRAGRKPTGKREKSFLEKVFEYATSDEAAEDIERLGDVAVKINEFLGGGAGSGNSESNSPDDPNNWDADDQLAYVKKPEGGFDGTALVIKAEIVFKKAGKYRIVYGWLNKGQWMRGAVIGTKYYNIETVTVGDDVTKTYDLRFGGRPASLFAQQWCVEVFPAQ